MGRNQEVESMKIVKILGGLGNQMFQYALYLSLQNHYPDETIKLDTSCFKGYPLHNGFELYKIFNIKEKEATLMDKLKIAYPYCHYRVWQILKRILPNRKSMLIENKEERYDSTVFSRIGNCYYDGYWQNERYFKDIRDRILQVFTQKTINEKNIDFVKELQCHESVSIHIRRGDYVSNPLYGGICNIEYYKQAIRYIQDHTSCNLYCIFSNDIEWCKQHLSSLLANKTVIYVNWNKGKDSYQDMYLMSHCKHNIIANSSFSWWGAWLNNNPMKIIVCPKRWNNIPNSEFELPQEWIKL